MNDFPATSLTLLQRAQAHQPAAWERLVDLYAPLVLHWGPRAGPGGAAARGRLPERLRAGAAPLAESPRDRPGDTFRGWLRTITRNKVLDHFRRRQRQPAGTGDSDVQRQLLELPDLAGNEPDPGEDDLLTRQLHQALELI